MHLLTDQIEFADVIILNKVADAQPHQVDTILKIIRSLNADARIIEITIRAGECHSGYGPVRL